MSAGLFVVPRNVPHILLVRCHWCSKQRPEFSVHRLASNQAICENCLEWHNKALEFLSGTFPPGCQECERTFTALCDSTPGVEMRLYVVPKDGIYQVLCASCVKPYLPKRADLYTGTQFGRESLKI